MAAPNIIMKKNPAFICVPAYSHSIFLLYLFNDFLKILKHLHYINLCWSQYMSYKQVFISYLQTSNSFTTLLFLGLTSHQHNTVIHATLTYNNKHASCMQWVKNLSVLQSNQHTGSSQLTQVNITGLLNNMRYKKLAIFSHYAD